jgi:hypothetical protein
MEPAGIKFGLSRNLLQLDDAGVMIAPQVLDAISELARRQTLSGSLQYGRDFPHYLLADAIQQVLPPRFVEEDVEPEIESFCKSAGRALYDTLTAIGVRAHIGFLCESTFTETGEFMHDVTDSLELTGEEETFHRRYFEAYRATVTAYFARHDPAGTKHADLFALFLMHIGIHQLDSLKEAFPEVWRKDPPGKKISSPQRRRSHRANRDSAKLDARLYALLRSKDCHAPFDDPNMLQAQIICILFDLIPAVNRAALLLNWEDDPLSIEDFKDFRSSMYGKRTGEPRRFRVSEEALEFVYAYRQSYMSANAMCAPLRLGEWTIFGAIYLDTRKPGKFKDKDMKVLESISVPAAKLLYRSRKRQADQEEMDSYHEFLDLDDFSELEGE